MPAATQLSGFAGFERVVRFDDPHSGLCAIIAIHSTALGPAAGGCRFARYGSFEEAAADAAALAHGMSRKNALADLPLGGGKSVIIKPDGAFDRQALMRSFGKAVDSLGGDYVTAEDVGTTVSDMKTIAGETRYVAGLPQQGDQAGGDPSPWTALGVFSCIEKVARDILHIAPDRLRVAVQGAGSVGASLVRRLSEAGASVIVADISDDRLAELGKLPGVEIAPVDAILHAEADILAPCAMGAVLTRDAVVKLHVRAVAGAANNQLAEAAAGEDLHKRGILYCPDFVINAGGIISVSAEYLGEDEKAVVRRVANIPGRLGDILSAAGRAGTTPQTMAEQMADERIAAGGKPPTNRKR